MNNLKRKVSLILSVIMVALAIFPLTISTATSNTDDVNMSVKLDGKELEYAHEYEVQGGDKIVINANSTNGASIAKIGYYYYDEGVSNLKEVLNSGSMTITLPTKPAGTERLICIEAVASNNKGTNDPANRTGWQYFYIKYVEEDNNAVVDGDINVKYNGKTLSKGSTTTAKAGEKVTLVSTPANRTKKIAFQWDSQGALEVASATYDLEIPKTFAAGTTHILYVKSVFDDGSKTEQKTYKFTIPSEQPSTPSTPSTPETIDGDINVKHNGKTLTKGSTTTVEAGEKVTLVSTPANRTKKIAFQWDNEGALEIALASYDLEIPTTFKPGTTHILYVKSVFDDGSKTNQKTYKFTIKADPTQDVDLDILPWEEENKDLDCLSISLRNDSESSKANKNLYSLGEDVTYYIDFANGGKDIKDEVKIQLELPLEFRVVDAANGTVDTNKGTITWVYPNGMEEGYEGTKTVVIQYVSFDRNSTVSEKIYPLATIAKEAKVQDDSAVINYVYKDDETVIEDTHEPYMYGDYSEGTVTTFRPDATITRAEGALVLTRILLGQEAINNVQVTSVYPDLGETYLEAQKAIIAATSYGIINGYTDGYYRPNQTMTRAEFMKIIAKFVELDAEDNGIDGLRIKEIEESIKLYKDPQKRYAVNGQLIGDHWAIEEVSLLVRLNMTSVDAKNKDLRMDKGITRAEVAQLVNFYLLRGPAEVTSRTKTQFSDVTKKHDLFTDIVEATRDAHDFTITEDGTEIAE